MTVPAEFMGCLICLAGCTTTALGLVLQKYSHQQNALCERPVLYYKQLWWILGFSIFLLSQILNMVALGMTPQVVMSCLGAWSLTFSAIFGRFLLGEKLQNAEQVMMIGAVLGVVCVLLGTPSATKEQIGVAEIYAKLLTPSVFLMLACALGFVSCLFAVSTFMMPDLLAVAWSILAAVLSGFTVLFFKSISLLFIAGGFTCLWKASTYVILALGLAMGAAQMHALNVGLQHGEAILVVPIYYALGMLAQIFTGGAVFAELERFSETRAVLFFWGGTLLLVLCIFGMTYSRIWGEVELTTEKTCLLDARSRSISQEWKVHQVHRIRSISLESEGLPSPGSKPRCLSSLDSEAFPESFGEGQRMYTVSVTGPPGLV